VHEADSLELIKACNSETEVWSPVLAILADCFLATQSFNSISFVHCFRETNEVAHELARYAYDTNFVIRWEDVPPSFILPFVLNDVKVL
jgi:hypothetical protein